nr:MAG TPA: x-prolyl-dipeptidyl aminopeptidase [Crassvirales sp.]
MVYSVLLQLLGFKVQECSLISMNYVSLETNYIDSLIDN